MPLPLPTAETGSSPFAAGSWPAGMSSEFLRVKRVGPLRQRHPAGAAYERRIELIDIAHAPQGSGQIGARELRGMLALSGSRRARRTRRTRRARRPRHATGFGRATALRTLLRTFAITGHSAVPR